MHGDPRVAAKDRQIRDWLRGHGWEVIEVTVAELGDPGAMAKHFRRLAGYLGDNDLRESVRRDTSWFATD